jgi:hypothetical protein
MCSLSVPVEYFSPLDENGRRRDADERPELSSGSVEFVAPTEYMVRPPMPPVYFFLIDVSLSAVKSGMVKVNIAVTCGIDQDCCSWEIVCGRSRVFEVVVHCERGSRLPCM